MQLGLVWAFTRTVHDRYHQTDCHRTAQLASFFGRAVRGYRLRMCRSYTLKGQLFFIMNRYVFREAGARLATI